MSQSRYKEKKTFIQVLNDVTDYVDEVSMWQILITVLKYSSVGMKQRLVWSRNTVNIWTFGQFHDMKWKSHGTHEMVDG